MDNGILYSDLRDYLTALNYETDSGSCIGNCETWEKPTGEYVVISIEGERVSAFMLTRILVRIGKTKEDFKLYLANKYEEGQ